MFGVWRTLWNLNGAGAHSACRWLQVKSVYEIFIIFCVLYTAIVEPVKVLHAAPLQP